MDSCSTAGLNPCPGHLSGMPQILFTQLINTLMASQCAIANPDIYPDNMADKLDSHYDFIVVGAGSAGSVIANRLTEVEHWKVLLLEAGGDPNVISEIPGLLFSNLGGPIDWGYKTEPQDEFCQGMIDKQCRWPKGKVLGGSSTINAMLYVRGHRSDYDSWAALGNEGWSYDEVLPYFKKSENLLVEVDEESSQIHGREGYLSVDKYEEADPFKPHLIRAWHEMGYEEIKGDKKLEGVVNSLGTLKDGKRHSTAKAFLAPIKNRENLHVAKLSHVTKILIDPETKAATGVEFQTGDTVKQVSARKEVVVSAGSVGSPQLLMLSGIGPKKHLEEIGIKPLVDLPVGQNLQDHFIHLGIVASINKTNPVPVPPVKLLEGTFAFFMGMKGIFSSIGLTNVLSFKNFESSYSGPLGYPDVEFHHIHLPYGEQYLISELTRAAGFTPKIRDSYLHLCTKSDVLIIVPTLLRPKSRGKILLKSANPLEHPTIIANYLSHYEDLEKMLRGTEEAVRLLRTNTMSSLEPRLERLEFDDCDAEVGSEDYWMHAIKNVGTTIYHPVGTCKMGPDAEAVVDSELKVKGVSGLRVADASIMPNIVSGNTNAAVIMIGEKMSDILKKKWLED